MWLIMMPVRRGDDKKVEWLFCCPACNANDCGAVDRLKDLFKPLRSDTSCSVCSLSCGSHLQGATGPIEPMTCNQNSGVPADDGAERGLASGRSRIGRGAVLITHQLAIRLIVPAHELSCTLHLIDPRMTVSPLLRAMAHRKDARKPRHFVVNSDAFSGPTTAARTRQTGAMPYTASGTCRQSSASAGPVVAMGKAHPDLTVADHLAAN